MTRFAFILASIGALAATAARPQDATEGEALFQSHCAYCHGSEAKGDGAEAGRLNPQPKDLTRLQAENAGVLPVERIVFRIDGRDPIVAHGSPMPVFGEYFEGEDTAIKSEKGQPIMTSKPIVDLVTWLASVQEK